MNLLLIDAVAFIDSSMMTAAAAILVSIRPSVPGEVIIYVTSNYPKNGCRNIPTTPILFYYHTNAF